MSFLGHGVGLEADEFPLLTARFPYPLEADMVLAFEPKIFLPEIGMIGLEDTAAHHPRRRGMADHDAPGGDGDWRIGLRLSVFGEKIAKS